MPSNENAPECAGQVVRKVGAVPMRILFLPVLAAALLPGVIHGQRPVTQPGSLAGAWETTTAAGTHGIFVRISTHASGSVDRQTITSQSIVVRVYHRVDGHETWGWYGDNGPAVSSIFDGERLRVAGLDATFHADTQRWSGTWLLDGETRDVVLERPRPDPDSTPNRLSGDWEGVPDSAWIASSRLHIVQSSDGTLTAWMDRTMFAEDQRHGELLRVVSADPSPVILELVSAFGRQYRFTGTLSSEGSRLSGSWNGLNAQSSFRRIQ